EVVRELARGAQVLLDRLGRPQVVAVLGGEAVRELLDLLGGAGVEGEVLLAPRGGVDGLAGPAPGEVLLLRLDRSERRRVGAGSPLYARRPVPADGPRDAVEVGRADVVRYRELGSGDAVRVDDERVLVPTDLLGDAGERVPRTEVLPRLTGRRPHPAEAVREVRDDGHAQGLGRRVVGGVGQHGLLARGLEAALEVELGGELDAVRRPRRAGAAGAEAVEEVPRG